MTTGFAASPSLAGHAWRPLGHQDAEALYRLERACAPVDGDSEPGSPAGYQRRLDGAADLLSGDTLCAVDATGGIAARAWVTFDDRFRHEYRALLDGLVHPAYRGCGLGGFLLNWMEARARKIHATMGAGRPLALRIGFCDRGPDAIALFEGHGFRFYLTEHDLYRDLSLPIPANPLPAGMRFLPWSPEWGGLFYRAYLDAFSTRPLGPGLSEEGWCQVFTGLEGFRADLCRLLLEGDEPIGYALGAIVAAGGQGPEEEGCISQMGVRPAWRRRGLAGCLLSETMRLFRAEELPYVWLNVNEDNPEARRVYERLGFVRARSFTVYHKEGEPGAPS